MVDIAQILAKNLKEIRKARKLTQDELSDQAGVAYSTVAKLEQGTIKSPSLSTTLALARVLDIEVEDLVRGAGGDQKVDSSTPVKMIFFDVNDVLVRFLQRAFTVLSHETDFSVDKIENVFWHYNTAGNRGEISMDEFNKYMSESLGLKDFKWEEYYLKTIEPITEVCDFIYELSGKIDIGLLTNGFPGITERMIKDKILPDIEYKAVVVSANVGHVKPEAKIYKEAEKMSSYSGQEILFVDNSRNNLIAAAQLDWRGLWFDHFRPEESIKRIREAIDA